MWETIGKVLNGNNAIPVLIFAVIVVIVLGLLGKKGIISINKGGVRIGSDERELSIVRNQSQWAYLFIMAIKGKVLTEDATDAQTDRAELVLEKVYDKVVDWIHYNHINPTNSYIEIKQGEIKSLVYSQDKLDDDYKTPEFETRMEGWVKELILNLIQIRKEFSQN